MASKNETKIVAEQRKQELFIIREFDAQRELVFKAFSDKDILVQWVGPKEMQMRMRYLNLSQVALTGIFKACPTEWHSASTGFFMSIQPLQPKYPAGNTAYLLSAPNFDDRSLLTVAESRYFLSRD